MKILLLTVAATLFASMSSADAVMLSPDGSGQVAIVPIYSTVGGVDTLLKIDSSSAVRVQFRGPNGEPLESFNVYFSGDSWSAAVTSGPDGPELITSDGSCFLGEGAGGMPIVIDSGVPISEPYGYVEVLEMGFVRAAEINQALYISDSSESRNCEELVSAFTDGLWAQDSNTGLDPPAGRMRVTATLVNVERGTQYSTQPIHLRGFRDAPFHVPPAEFYGLADARDPGKDSGATRSVICTDECVVEEWAEPLDAVASTLMVNAMKADFVVNPALGASSTAVVVRPLLAYYGEDHPVAAGRFGLRWSDSEFGSQPIFCVATPPPGNLCPLRTISDPLSDQPIQFAFSPNVVDWPQPDVVPIIALPGAFPIGSVPSHIEPLRSGTVTAEYWFRSQRWLTSNDGTLYIGHPALMIMLTELVNGQIIDGDGNRVRANYGHAAAATRIVESEEPEG